MTRRTLLNTATAMAASRPTEDDISLAAWSINRSFFAAHRWKNLDLPRIAREPFNINGLEFVNQFFENPTMGYLNQLKKNGDAHGVRFVLIMIDGDPDVVAKLMKAVDNPNFGNVNPGDDHAEVIRKIAPYAKGISVKAAWAADGTHSRRLPVVGKKPVLPTTGNCCRGLY